MHCFVIYGAKPLFLILYSLRNIPIIKIWDDFFLSINSDGLSNSNMIPTQHTASKSFIFQNELMVDIYSKSLARAIGKVLLMKFS